jgi:hypothetical protein
MARTSEPVKLSDRPTLLPRIPPSNPSPPKSRDTSPLRHSYLANGETNAELDTSPFNTPPTQTPRTSQYLNDGRDPIPQYAAPFLPPPAFAANGMMPFTMEVYPPRLNDIPSILLPALDFGTQEEIGASISRPATAASGDTYHQAQTLFHDFDGAHYAPSIREDPSNIGNEETDVNKRASTVLPGSDSPVQRPKYPPPAAGMVYYPAPVPMTLNLPQRLSTATPAQLEARRRTQVISTIPPEARKSAIWLKHERSASCGLPATEDEDAVLNAARLSKLPAQLRASMFFQTPSASQEVEIKDRSAVRTLDDLLDASTEAPVSAFTDHMFAGKAGAKVYKKEPVEMKRVSTMPVPENMNNLKENKTRLSSFLGLRRKSITSEIALNDDSKSKRSWSRSFSLGAKLDDSALQRDADGNIVGRARSGATTPMPGGDGGDNDGSNGSEDDDPDFDMPSDDEDDLLKMGPPTTLLAELQIRKEAQKQRNRTALSAFPSGMHSTLLELDAVAQIQKQKRKNARVTLAWENPEQDHPEQANADDEDVPLGVLFASNGKVKEQLKGQGMAEWDRPMGLIELREREDNEPLSMRRARLRGVNPYQLQERTPSMMFDLAVTPAHEFVDPVDGEAEEVEETLAERLARLKKKSEQVTETQPIEAENGAKSRPISKAFTDELLGEFGLASTDHKTPEDPSLSNPISQADQGEANEVPEEEETLGQRRARLQRQAQRQSTMPIQQETAQPAIAQIQRPPLRASTSLADLLHTVPSGTTRKVSDKQLVDNLPNDSLLKQSEDIKAARKSQLRDAALRTTSGGFGAAPLLDMTGVDRQQRTMSGFQGGFFNNGYGGSTPAGGLQGNNNMMDVRQSMMFGGSTPGMGYPGVAGPFAMSQQDLALQQAQMLNYQNAQIANMMSMSMGGMPFGGMPFAPPFQNGLGGAASTPNLLSGMMNGQHPMMMMQQPKMMGGQVPPGSDPAFMDTNDRARIDAWRQSVQMD